jgi:hypothetical protein
MIEGQRAGGQPDLCVIEGGAASTDNLSVTLRRSIGLVRLSSDDRNDRSAARAGFGARSAAVGQGNERCMKIDR